MNCSIAELSIAPGSSFNQMAGEVCGGVGGLWGGLAKGERGTNIPGEQSHKKQKSATSDRRKIIKHLSNLIQFNHQNIIRIISSDQSKSSKEFIKLLQSKGNLIPR